MFFINTSVLVEIKQYTNNIFSSKNSNRKKPYFMHFKLDFYQPSKLNIRYIVSTILLTYLLHELIPIRDHYEFSTPIFSPLLIFVWFNLSYINNSSYLRPVKSQSFVAAEVYFNTVAKFTWRCDVVVFVSIFNPRRTSFLFNFWWVIFVCQWKGSYLVGTRI